MGGGSTTTVINNGRHVALKLYRDILRAHKKHLPTNEMKLLGDKYVKSEFKLHKNVTNDTHLKQFFIGWDEYLNHITQTGRKNDILSVTGQEKVEKDNNNISSSSTDDGFGQNLPSGVELSEEQVHQLEKLKEETTKSTTR